MGLPLDVVYASLLLPLTAGIVDIAIASEMCSEVVVPVCQSMPRCKEYVFLLRCNDCHHVPVLSRQRTYTFPTFCLGWTYPCYS